MSVNKAKAAGISASSFFDLKAELSKQEDEFAKKRAAGLSTAIIGGVKRPEKVRYQPPIYSRCLIRFVSARNQQSGLVRTQE